MPITLMTALALAASVAAIPAPERFALVVTNNRSLDTSRPDLHFADDDGVQWSRLLSEQMGADHVMLLTALDAESAAIYPDLQGKLHPPTRAELDRAVTSLAGRLSEAKARGAATEAVLVLAGHGDIAQGEGYLELADGRLTARDLDEAVVAKLPADRLHLVLDSCNSYFLLNPRKPGGQRWVAPTDESRNLLRKYPHVGALISTSAEALTYEWSELQSGIFSYEVRSGLRGAADADGDGRITYAEMAAFLAVVNAPVPNALYRPKVFAQGPQARGEEPLWSLSTTTARTLRIDAKQARRVTLRDQRGVRVADLHAEAGTRVSLVLPQEELSSYEVVAAGDRPQVRERALPVAAELDLDVLTETPPHVATRGEAPVFKDLFAKPFGPVAFKAEQTAAQQAPEPVPFSVSFVDAERLARHLASAASGGATVRRQAAGAFFALGLASAGLSLPLSTSAPGGPSREDYVSAAITGGIPVAFGLLMLAQSSPEESLHSEFLSLDLSTEASRTTNVLATERKFRELADSSRTIRHVMNYVMLGLGAFGLGMGLYSKSIEEPRLTALSFGVGALGLGYGLYNVAVDNPSPIENAWKLYSSEIGPRESAPEQPKVTVAPAIGLGTLGISGTF